MLCRRRIPQMPCSLPLVLLSTLDFLGQIALAGYLAPQQKSDPLGLQVSVEMIRFLAGTSGRQNDVPEVDAGFGSSQEAHDGGSKFRHSLSLNLPTYLPPSLRVQQRCLLYQRNEVVFSLSHRRR